MHTPQKADYCIEFDFSNRSRNPARIYQLMAELIDALSAIDAFLLTAIDIRISHFICLESIEAAPLRTFIRAQLKTSDTESFKTHLWELILRKFLVTSKTEIFSFLSLKRNIRKPEDILLLNETIRTLAKKTDVKWLPIYQQVSSKEFLIRIKNIFDCFSSLDQSDKINYITHEGKTALNTHLNVAIGENKLTHVRREIMEARDIAPVKTYRQKTFFDQKS
ncbi:MAG: hypothetical protein KJ737_05205 [Proteobacteria bacterium]|nr:hypothetical protein [Pseudomonadota bacterium]